MPGQKSHRMPPLPHSTHTQAMPHNPTQQSETRGQWPYRSAVPSAITGSLVYVKVQRAMKFYQDTLLQKGRQV